MSSFSYTVTTKKVHNRLTNHGCREVHLLTYRWRCCQQFPFKTFRTESIISLSLWQREETSEFFLFSLAVSQHYPRGAQDICRNKWLGNVFLKMEKFSLSLPKRRKGEVKKRKRKKFPESVHFVRWMLFRRSNSPLSKMSDDLSLPASWDWKRKRRDVVVARNDELLLILA